jgi:hypothetical protein
VLDHGGQMWVETGGKGACFAFCLPKGAHDTIRTGSGRPGLPRP